MEDKATSGGTNPHTADCGLYTTRGALCTCDNSYDGSHKNMNDEPTDARPDPVYTKTVYPLEEVIGAFSYRKKPVVIEAFKYNPHETIFPLWLSKAVLDGNVRMSHREATIETLEGTMTANVGDWIIRGVKGELYPCKPDIFEATYDKV